jgi:hypothetical protein
MPSAAYSLDARGDTIAHVGADLYGSFGLKKGGSLGYMVYGGQRPSDIQGGFVYGLESSSMVTTPSGPVYLIAVGKKIDSYGGPVFRADLRWTTPWNGLMFGASYMKLDTTTRGSYVSNQAPYVNHTRNNQIAAFYAQQTIGKLTINAEYRKEKPRYAVQLGERPNGGAVDPQLAPGVRDPAENDQSRLRTFQTQIKAMIADGQLWRLTTQRSEA